MMVQIDNTLHPSGKLVMMAAAFHVGRNPTTRARTLLAKKASTREMKLCLKLRDELRLVEDPESCPQSQENVSQNTDIFKQCTYIRGTLFS